jgi:hypothetical protein
MRDNLRSREPRVPISMLKIRGGGGMRALRVITLLSVVSCVACVGTAAGEQKKAVASKKKMASVKVVPDESNRKVDVFMDGQPFTSYIYPTTLKKPVLFPLRTSSGVVITRAFPPLPGERTDHPHHVGLWFNYGNVDGIDFWNNSDAIKPEDRGHMGTIEHRRVVAARSGGDKGELEVEADWVGPDGKAMLREHTLFVFRGDAAMRSVDRITRLTALDRTVKFPDDKEGVLGMRVARSLELPSEKAETFTDSTGRAITVAAMDNSVVTGDYLTSEGKRGNAAWGTRGHWCILTGKVNQQPVTIAILDHPGNPGFPTYWHARGYGLFAANPLGQKALSNGKDELNFSLGPNQSVTFRYRVLILSAMATADDVEKAYQDFAAQSQ